MGFNVTNSEKFSAIILSIFSLPHSFCSWTPVMGMVDTLLLSYTSWMAFFFLLFCLFCFSLDTFCQSLFKFVDFSKVFTLLVSPSATFFFFYNLKFVFFSLRISFCFSFIFFVLWLFLSIPYWLFSFSFVNFIKIAAFKLFANCNIWVISWLILIDFFLFWTWVKISWFLQAW